LRRNEIFVGSNINAIDPTWWAIPASPRSLTAIANAFGCPMITTWRLPRVTPA
jgi:hypothetical protein